MPKARADEPVFQDVPRQGERPGDAFNRLATWPEVLEPHGWLAVGEYAGVTRWRRPGKDRDHSRHSFLPIHNLCLFRLGVPLGEMWYLHELASWLREHNRSRFLLTAPPLRLPGAVGSPVTPVATV